MKTLQKHRAAVNFAVIGKLLFAWAGIVFLSAEARAAEPPAVAPANKPVEERYTGSPKEASSGGRERDLPDYAGIFPNSPISLIVPPIKAFEKWTSEELRLDLGFRAAYFFQQATGGEGERTAAAHDYRM